VLRSVSVARAGVGEGERRGRAALRGRRKQTGPGLAEKERERICRGRREGQNGGVLLPTKTAGCLGGFILTVVAVNSQERASGMHGRKRVCEREALTAHKGSEKVHRASGSATEIWTHGKGGRAREIAGSGAPQRGT